MMETDMKSSGSDPSDTRPGLSQTSVDAALFATANYVSAHLILSVWSTHRASHRGLTAMVGRTLAMEDMPPRIVDAWNKTHSLDVLCLRGAHANVYARVMFDAIHQVIDTPILSTEGLSDQPRSPHAFKP
jgi:hypothetical protein